MSQPTDPGANPLGEFLRARRELVRPADVGLPAGGRRRVPGLRRAEVATLAGISQEYYLRLEQGRDRNPSDQVLRALADVLQLDAEAIAYMSELVRERPRSGRTSRTTPHPAVVAEAEVPVGVRMLLVNIDLPAFVVDRYRDVLAANGPAGRLSPDLVAGANRLVWLFTASVARDYHPDWERNTVDVVAQLRRDVGADVDDPRLHALVGELSLKSERFRELWARHDVVRGTGASATVVHPSLGELHLRREKLVVSGADHLTLVVYHAEPGSTSAARLATLAATDGRQGSPSDVSAS